LVSSFKSLYKAFKYPEATKATFQIENPAYQSQVRSHHELYQLVMVVSQEIHIICSTGVETTSCYQVWRRRSTRSEGASATPV
jgi:hypothetical protein